MQRKETQRGFTLLISILVVSILMTVALGIADIIVKENILSSYLRESQVAFFAADRGMDCALFWNMTYNRASPSLQFTPFPTSTLGSSYNYPPGWNTIDCNGTNLSTSGWSVTNQSPTTATTDFHLNFADNGSCVDVQVAVNGPDTTFRAQGFNNCVVGSPRRTERTLEVSTNI